MQKSTLGFKANAFHCPHCRIYAKQEWYNIAKGHLVEKSAGYCEDFLEDMLLSLCSSCGKYALWLDDRVIYPASSIAPWPLAEMPDDVKEEFLEARNVVNTSPRTAAALLRLALQRLTVCLGESGKDMNKDVANLVRKGLPKKVQKALRAVRAIGRRATQPGMIDPEDDTKTAIALFNLVNMTVDFMISQPKKVNNLYTELPITKKKKIHKHRRRKPKKLRKWESIPKPTIDYR